MTPELMRRLEAVDRVASQLPDKDWHAALVISVYFFNFEHHTNHAPTEAIAAYLGLREERGS